MENTICYHRKVPKSWKPINKHRKKHHKTLKMLIFNEFQQQIKITLNNSFHFFYFNKPYRSLHDSSPTRTITNLQDLPRCTQQQRKTTFVKANLVSILQNLFWNHTIFKIEYDQESKLLSQHSSTKHTHNSPKTKKIAFITALNLCTRTLHFNKLHPVANKLPILRTYINLNI